MLTSSLSSPLSSHLSLIAYVPRCPPSSSLPQSLRIVHRSRCRQKKVCCEQRDTGASRYSSQRLSSLLFHSLDMSWCRRRRLLLCHGHSQRVPEVSDVSSLYSKLYSSGMVFQLRFKREYNLSFVLTTPRVRYCVPQGLSEGVSVIYS